MFLYFDSKNQQYNSLIYATYIKIQKNNELDNTWNWLIIDFISMFIL